MSTGGSSSMSTSGVSNLFADIRKVGGLEFVMRIQSDVVAQLYIISMYNPARTELMEISIPAKTAQPMTFYSEHRVLGGKELVIQVQELPFPHAIGIRVTDAESGEAVKVTESARACNY